MSRNRDESRAKSVLDVKAAPICAYDPTTMQAETTSLMLAARAGDREAFDRLYKSVQGLAFRLAQALVGSRDDALDLAQEALMRTYKARESFREGEHFLPWFRRILRNTCYSWLRRHGKLRARSNDESGESEHELDDWELADPDADTPLDPLLSEERAQALRRALARLGANDREILLLRHSRALSYKELAHLLALPEGTVMSRLFYARRRLRAQLGPEFTAELEAQGGRRDERRA
ncbi:MAG: RNA polymerase sigma factor [Planctomycetes bacterium]|nr:RNA polymerase sigma factor [Planctomycetota bacterium]